MCEGMKTMERCEEGWIRNQKLIEFTQVLSKTWKTPLFQYICDESGEKDSCGSLIPSYEFNIGTEASSNLKQNEHFLKCEAFLVVCNSKLRMCVTLSDVLSYSMWTVVARIEWVGMLDENSTCFFNTKGVEGESNLRTGCWIDLLTLEEAKLRPSQEVTLRFRIFCRVIRPQNLMHLDSGPAGVVSHLQDDLECLLKDSNTADIEIRVGDSKEGILCHKSILSGRSPVFRKMLETNMIESTENVLEVEDISFEGMGHFIHFLYCARFEDASWIKYLPELVYASDKYCVDSLKELCDRNVLRILNCSNALSLGTLAVRHGLPTAVGYIRKFISLNANELVLECKEY